MENLIRRLKTLSAEEVITLLIVVMVAIAVIPLLVDRFLSLSPAPNVESTAGATVTTTAAPGAGLLASSPTLAATATPAQQVVSPSLTPEPAARAPDLPTVTPPPGGQVYRITPGPETVGWARQGDDRPNHFGDYNIFAGTFDSQTRIGAVQFDLSEIPRGAPVVYADLTLVGLSDTWLGSQGTWHVELLQSWMGEEWTAKGYAALQRPDGTELALSPALSTEDLGVGRANTIVLSSSALQALEARIWDGRVSFRVRGPVSESDNLFTWDSGYGSGSRGRKPTLRLVAGPAPATPPPSPTPHYVIVTVQPTATPTPTPENVVTQAALARTATARATAAVEGGEPTATRTPTATFTPLPGNWVTPVIVVPTATPGSSATAEWQSLVATSQAVVRGTPTPLPPNAWTATPEPAPAAEEYVIVTLPPESPTPENVVTQAALLRTPRPTATPLPSNWVTPVVIVPTATPGNTATAEWQSLVATAEAVVHGTPTPLPPNVWTATPVPWMLDLEAFGPTATPTPPPGATPTPGGLPAVLRGRIAFRSSRLPGDERILVMRPDGSEVMALAGPWPYEFADAQQLRSPDGAEQAIVRLVAGEPRLFRVSLVDGAQGPLTPGQFSYDPAWSPSGDWIAYAGHAPDGNEEIYRIRTDGSERTRLTFTPNASEKSPSWSPDGGRIVFSSDRGTGQSQIWVMNADGTAPVNLSDNQYRETDPVWLK